MINQKASILSLLFALLLFSSCKNNVSASQISQCKHSERVNEKCSWQVKLSEEAREVMLKFQQALKESKWEKALSYSSEHVRAKAKEYESTEAFFRDVVPVEAVVQTARIPLTRAKASYGRLFYSPFDWSFRTSDPDMEHKTAWQPYIYKTEVGWLIDFRTTPLKVWIEQYKAQAIRSRQMAKEREARRKEFEPKIKRIKTKTCLVPISEEFALGRPMLFRLELVNEGEVEFLYDHQQVAVNCSMTITDEDGKAVPYIAGPFQTSGAFVSIKPGETAILFDNFDISKQYDIGKPGRYKVQFSGNGLAIGITTGEEEVKPFDNFIGIPKRFPSNMVEINVKLGEM